MSDDAATVRWAQAVDALRAEAREHKRLSGYHRRRARDLMATAAGIAVEYAQTEEVTADGKPAHP